MSHLQDVTDKLPPMRGLDENAGDVEGGVIGRRGWFRRLLDWLRS